MNQGDKTEKAFRFGCGFVFGILLFGLSSIWYAYDGGGGYVGLVLFAALAFGFASLRFGDKFWRWFAQWFSWFS